MSGLTAVEAASESPLPVGPQPPNVRRGVQTRLGRALRREAARDRT